MPFMPRSLPARLLPALLLLPILPACSGIPASYAIHDLQAIHDPSEGRWEPAVRAALRVPPEDYLEGARGAYLTLGRTLEEYQLEDHRALELAILERIARTPLQDLETTLEATAWLTVELLADDHDEARVRAVAILARFAGYWIERAGVRVREAPPSEDLAAAVTAYEAALREVDRPDYRENLAAALARIDEAAIPDALVAARLVAGLGRSIRDAPLPATGVKTLQRTAVRAILVALREGAGDPDPRVAEACRRNLELLERHARAR